MQADWQAHLANYKAHIDDGKVTDFGNTAAEIDAIDKGIIIADLSHFGLISITGAEAQDFLQNQLSNDVKLVTTEQSQLSSYCNPKGRILASFRLFMRQDTYLMEMPHTIVEQTMNRLRMFVMRSQVELNDASEQWLRIGVAGPDCEKLLAEQLGQYPEGIDGVCQVDELTLIRLPGTTARFEILAPAEKIIELWDKLTGDKLANKATPVAPPPGLILISWRVSPLFIRKRLIALCHKWSICMLLMASVSKRAAIQVRKLSPACNTWANSNVVCIWPMWRPTTRSHPAMNCSALQKIPRALAKSSRPPPLRMAAMTCWL